MNLTTLVALGVSIAGMAVLDARYRLFLWRTPRRAAAVLGAGVAFLLAWDVAGIVLGIFSREANPYSTGLLLAPHLPVEEPVFLAFLCQLAMVCYTGAVRLLERRTRRDASEAGHASPARGGSR